MESTSLNVLVLNASLKHGESPSNTEEVTQLVLQKLGEQAEITHETLRLSDLVLPVGVSYKENSDDEWPIVVDKMIAADILIFATPIWWGGRSSLMQRVIERMDSFDEGSVPGGRGALLNKVAGIIITGSEDGAQAVLAGMMEAFTFMNLTLPPQCCTYWVGEVGMDPQTDAERRRKNPAVAHMAEKTAKSLAFYAQLLKKNPMPSDEK